MGYIPGLGDGQQLVGAQMVLAAMGARNGTKKRRKKTKAAATKRRTKKKRVRAAKRPARLVKGSAAAKRYMASIRKRRK